MNKQSTLSVVMITKNEEKHLEKCLESVCDLADEIIILDSGSTDNTQTIAEKYQAKFLTNTDWQGFGKQRQLAQSYAQCDYILAIDADEQLDTKLQKSIAKILANPLDQKQAFAFMRRNIFLGKPLYGRWYRSRIDRLYARDSFNYLSKKVHESLDCNRNQSIILKGTLNHLFCDNLDHFITKNLRYSEDWGSTKHTQGKKITLWGIYTRSWLSFAREYFGRGAWLSGSQGLVFSIVGANYTYNKYLFLWHLNRRKKPNS